MLLWYDPIIRVSYGASQQFIIASYFYFSVWYDSLIRVSYGASQQFVIASYFSSVWYDSLIRVSYGASQQFVIYHNVYLKHIQFMFLLKLFVKFFFISCCRPLPHFRSRPHWKPPGNPEYARNTLRFPKDEESCKIGKHLHYALLDNKLCSEIS